MGQRQSESDEITLWIIVAVLAMVGLAILVILVSRVAMNRISQEQEKLRTIEKEHQRNLLENTMMVQERERKRLAGELHDDLSSLLNVLRIQLYRSLKDHPSKQGNLELLDKSIDISRNISHELYPPMLADFGLIETINDFLHPLQASYSVAFNVSEQAPMPTNDQWSLQLFRIVQELISNMVKHAECTELTCLLRVTTTYAALLFTDNGKGFDIGTTKTGLGLSNIESRVRVLDGRYRIKSQPDVGTRTLVLIPAQ